jgi:hypothetical protein
MENTSRAGIFAGLVLVLISIVEARNPQARPTAASSQDYSFKVDASQPWNDTGLDLNPGDLVHIYGGTIACGGPYPSEKKYLPLPSAKGGSLLAKLHAEATPVLATPDAELPIVSPSHLYLGVNGINCSGALPAKVHVERKSAK